MKLILFLTLLGRTCADYDCLCNYDIEKSVYLAQSVTSSELGYMYEFDCKQILPALHLTNGWKSVAFDHQVGFVKTDTNTITQVCTGDPPADDMVTTANPQNGNNVTSTIPTTTNSNSVVSQKQTTAVNTTTTVATSQPTTVKSITSTASTIAPSSVTTKSTAGTSTVTSSATTSKEQTSSTRTTTKAATTSKPTTVQMMTTTVSTIAPSSATTIEQTTTGVTTTKVDPTTKLTTTTVKAMTTSGTTMAPTSATTVSTMATPMVTSSVSALPNSASHICPQAVYDSTMADNATLIINQAEKKCYEFVQSRQTWSTAEANCQKNGGHLVTVRNVNENNELYAYVKAYGHSVWLGLNDNLMEEQFTWISGETSSYTNWRAGHHNVFIHGREDCVCMLSSTGHWEDLGCTVSYAYICEYEIYEDNKDKHVSIAETSIPDVSGNAATQTPMNNDGNVHLCPLTDVLAARTDTSTMLGQYGDSCYVLKNGSRETWTSAEYKCKRNGGHLAHITNADEQNFIVSFLKRHTSPLATWIGLSDTKHEGQFQWSTGDAVTYTNWITGFNGTHHNSEDCVVLLPNQTGKWDEVYCGSHGGIFSSQTELHQMLCQYKTQAHASSILIG